MISMNSSRCVGFPYKYWKPLKMTRLETEDLDVLPRVFLTQRQHFHCHYRGTAYDISMDSFISLLSTEGKLSNRTIGPNMVIHGAYAATMRLLLCQ